MVVGCEEGFAAERGTIVDEFGDGACDGQSVVGGGAASDLIEDGKGARVAWLRIPAVSTISTMKVERPPAMSSETPMRVKMRSTMPMRADFAGTKLPIWARMTRMAACRM